MTNSTQQAPTETLPGRPASTRRAVGCRNFRRRRRFAAPRLRPRPTGRPRSPWPSTHASQGFGECCRTEGVAESWPLR